MNDLRYLLRILLVKGGIELSNRRVCGLGNSEIKCLVMEFCFKVKF